MMGKWRKKPLDSGGSFRGGLSLWKQSLHVCLNSGTGRSRHRSLKKTWNITPEITVLILSKDYCARSSLDMDCSWLFCLFVFIGIPIFVSIVCWLYVYLITSNWEQDRWLQSLPVSNTSEIPDFSLLIIPQEKRTGIKLDPQSSQTGFQY